jgi:hypothetical protein
VRADFLEFFTRLLDGLTVLVDAYPWVAAVIVTAPGLAGLLRGSIAGTLLGTALGIVGVLAGYVGDWWGILIWCCGWLVAGWLGGRRAHRRLEARRHRETLAAINSRHALEISEARKQ